MFPPPQQQIFFAFVVLWMVGVIQYSRSCGHRVIKNTEHAKPVASKEWRSQRLPSNAVARLNDAYQF